MAYCAVLRVVLDANNMEGFVNELVSMGFPQNRAEKAVFFTKKKGVQPALDWYGPAWIFRAAFPFSIGCWDRG